MELIRRDTDYALRALVYLAGRPGDVVSSREVASVQDVPVGFLQKVFQKCSKRGLVSASRGPAGGFSLVRPPEEVTVLDVVEAVQGPVTASKCLLGDHVCPRRFVCPLRKRWLKVGEDISGFLKGITLKDLADELAAVDHR